MIATVDEEELRVLKRETGLTGGVVLLTTPTGGVTQAIVKILANSSYVTVETEPVPKSNIFDTKYSRQREWWNTPKKERRRKK